jgi:cell filamentation protein
MTDFERRELADCTPCHFEDPTQLARALALVHAEFVLIHPFREGNGRCARILALLMALQAGLPPLDFSVLGGKGKGTYIAAVHAAVAKDYEPITACFANVIRRTWRRYGDATIP